MNQKNTAKALKDRLCHAAVVLLYQYGCVGTVTLYLVHKCQLGGDYLKSQIFLSVNRESASGLV